MNIGEVIKTRRKEVGMSADDLAKKIGVSRSTVFRYENGDIEKVPANVMNSISKTLGLSMVDLYDWDNKYNKDGRLAKEAQEVRKTQDELSAIDVLDMGSMLEFLIEKLGSNDDSLKFEGADLDDELREVLKNSLSNIYETAKLLNKK